MAVSLQASNTGFLVQLFQASVSPLVDGAQRSLQEMGDQCLSLGDKVRGWVSAPSWHPCIETGPEAAAISVGRCNSGGWS